MGRTSSGRRDCIYDQGDAEFGGKGSRRSGDDPAAGVGFGFEPSLADEGGTIGGAPNVAAIDGHRNFERDEHFARSARHFQF